MKIEVTTNIALEWFHNYGRDNYYSWEGMDELLNYYDEVDPNIEFDVIGICGECTEYGDNCNLGLDVLISDFAYCYSIDDYCEENDLTPDEVDKGEFIEELINNIEYNTTVLRISNGDYIVFNY